KYLTECKTDKPLNFNFFPEFSKSVNLGSSLLVTGGIIDKITLNTSYLISTECNYNDDQYYLTYFSTMNEPRNRHNIIYLPCKNEVLICSGPCSKSVEIANLTDKNWIQISSLQNERTNATMAFVNQNFIYCIGGYQNNNYGNNEDGIMLNSA